MTPFSVLLLWTFSLLCLVVPPESRAAFQEKSGRIIPREQRETAAEGRLRYQSIAEDLVAVVTDPEVKPLFPGKRGRERTIVVTVAVAVFEGGLRRDVDLGEGKLARGDHGRSHCLMQIQTGIGQGTVPAKDPVVSTWTGADLTRDRKKCFRAGIEMMRQSMAACKDLPEGDRLSAYTTGTCREDEPASRSRVHYARKILSMLPLPKREEALPSPPAAAASPASAHAAP